ncbi:Hypothetical protein BCD_1356 (plasmid) [Borrelia crocidurae DOU]|uniref:Uncharacterized protein n=1 Tax=Borrelia crocidurae DOU TaxID=1293575 RepID=W5SKJ0_9SPIR|nr:hypothetical protein [Borrelia crocidurae]AHH07422.1 Hypothetical protein BCD_1356 [Borrelia crocidurae DOU]
MHQMYRIIFVFSVFILCCRQDRGDISNGQLMNRDRKISGSMPSTVLNNTHLEETKTSGTGDLRHNKLGVDLSINIKPVGDLSASRGTENVDDANTLALPPSVLSNGSPNIPSSGEKTPDVVDEDKGSDHTQQKQRTFEEAYDALKTSIDNLKALYYYRSDKFSEYTLDKIMSDVKLHYGRASKNNVYAALNGDMHTLSRLEIIMRYSVGSWSSQYNYPHYFFRILGNLGGLIFKIIDEKGEIFSDENLSKLKNSQDFGCIDVMTDTLNVVHKKWSELIKIIQDRIIEASNLDSVFFIVEHLSLIADIYDNSKNFEEVKIRVLKDELTNLRSSLRDKVYELTRRHH